MTLPLSFRPLSLVLTVFSALSIAPHEATSVRPATLRPMPSDLPPPGEPQAMTRVDKSADGLFYVTALVNDVPVRFVVDTGSNIVVLTPTDAARAGVGLERAGRDRVTTVGGTTAMRRAVVRRLELNGQHFERERAIVTAGVPASLLGQNVLQQLESVTLRGDQLELR